jgi:drug/metabolite transporter (DMT)-like permease
MPFGYILALITSLFFSIAIVPRKFSKAPATTYTLFAGFCFTLLSVISYMVMGIRNGFGDLMNPIFLVSGLSGVVWSAGFVLFMKSIDAMGIARANQWKNFQGPMAAVIGLVFLGEHAQVGLIYVFGAVVAIFASAMLFTVNDEKVALPWKKGIGFALSAAVCFSLVPPLQRHVLTNGGGILEQQLYFGVFVFVTMAIFVLCIEQSLMVLKEIRNIDNIWGIIAGALLFIRTLLEQNTYARVPVSIAFTIIQFNAVWTALIGVMYFKEIDFKRHWVRICGGIGLAIVGVVALVFA